MADGDYLSKQSDIEEVFGKDNVQRWADADNKGIQPDIDVRIDWANRVAEEHFIGRILDGPYDQEEIVSIKPHMCVTCAATRAGLYLYDTRRITDAPETTDRVDHHRKNYNEWVKEIMSGQLKLRHPTTKEPLTRVSGNAPFVVQN